MYACEFNSPCLALGGILFSSVALNEHEFDPPAIQLREIFKWADPWLNIIGSYQCISVCNSSTAIPPISPKTSQLERKCPKYIFFINLYNYSLKEPSRPASLHLNFLQNSTFSVCGSLARSSLFCPETNRVSQSKGHPVSGKWVVIAPDYFNLNKSVLNCFALLASWMMSSP